MPEEFRKAMDNTLKIIRGIIYKQDTAADLANQN